MRGDERVRCPECDAPAARRIALYGSQLMTSQYRCDACGALFERLRWTAPEAPIAEGHHHGPAEPRMSFPAVLRNLGQPLPLDVKVRRLVANVLARLVPPAPCCGHPGEPGC